jgi:hypothetical protein
VSLKAEVIHLTPAVKPKDKNSIISLFSGSRKHNLKTFFLLFFGKCTSNSGIKPK